MRLKKAEKSLVPKWQGPAPAGPKFIYSKHLGPKVFEVHACIGLIPGYNTRMKNEKLPQGTPRTDNPNIIEWFGPGRMVLQLVKLGSNSSHYRFYQRGCGLDSGYYDTKRWSLEEMLDILNR